MSEAPTLPSDRQLVVAVRSGNDAAWAELMSRHEASVRMIRPRRGSNSKRDVGRAMDELRKSILTDAEPAEEEFAVRAFRPRAIGACTGGTYGPRRADPDAPAADTDAQLVEDQRLLAAAFGRLPEPWQTVLWHTSVEQLSAAEVSPLVGRTVNEVGELIATAQRGLIDSFLREYAEREQLDDESEQVVSLLGGYMRNSLPPHEQRIVEQHLHTSQPETTVVAGPDTDEPPRPDPERDDAPTDDTDDTDDAADTDAEVVSAEAVEDDPAPSVQPVDGGTRVHTAADSRRLVEIISSVDDWLPAAIAPGVTGLSVEDHRAALGTTTRSFDTATLFANRSTRVRRLALVGSAFAIVIALVGAAFLIRRPFESDDSTSVATVETAPETTAAGSTETTTTTTVLELRPEGQPENPIELVFDAGTRAIGFAAPRLDLSVVVGAPGPILAGGTGTIDIEITNDGPTTVETNFEMQLPRGIAFDAVAGGDVECADPPDDSPFCNATAASGETTTAEIRLRLESSVVGRLIVDGDLIAEPLDVPIVGTRHLVDSAVVRGDVLTIGNSLMTCSDAAAAADDISCDDVRDGVGDIVNRWDVPMEFVGADPVAGFVNSSSATLDLPSGADVIGAHLYWSGDLDERGVSIPADGSNELVTLVAPDGTVSELAAERVILGDVDATQYLGSVDVTELIAAGGAGEYTVGNVQSVEVQGSYAGWSLVVITADDDQPRRQMLITQPFDWVAPEPRFEYEVDLPVAIVEGGVASLDVIAFEGELGFVPESFVVGGEAVGGDNAFDGSIEGERRPAVDNNLGVDIDTYDLEIDTPDGKLRIFSESEKDGIRIAVLAIAVDLES